MGNNTRETIWFKNNIPALEYCSVVRAAELLGCKVKDILHFAEIGGIELSAKLEGFEASLTSPLRFRGDDLWEDNFQFPYFLNKYHVNSRISLFSPMIQDETHIDSEKKTKYLYEYNESPGLKKPLVKLYGLWAIKPSALLGSAFFNKLSSCTGVSLSPLDFYFKEADVEVNSDVVTASPKTEFLYPDNGLDISRLHEIINLTMADLFLTKKQVEIFYNCVGDVMPSHITGEVRQSEESGNIIKAERLTVHQFSFIYGLLRMLDISDEDIISASPGEINKLLSQKAAAQGVPFSPPDKNTWARWREKFPVK
ncbi:TPA: hypothetical protein MAQ57_000073 [Klebsiella pneumoniae]|uniref:hypothetical protein n=1 Tax=Klebsiella pneumoniae TaxID=573 RepID=UPI0007CD1946|nr:hypothetical protein [Klebsiella pneumoniae]SAW94935.1 Uncharacterised protein [Klebsiella pneumoniae]HBS7387590.1 hypothetical protein [Klebsiella pneumoniae]